MSRRFGIRMDGVEGFLEDLIKQHLAAQPPGHTYTLLEIGSAGCVSLRAFRDIIAENRKDNWRVVGLDLVNGWSLDWKEIGEAFGGTPVQMEGLIMGVGEILRTVLPAEGSGLGHMVLYLVDSQGDPRRALRNGLVDKIDLCFVDGCHGECAAKDFLAVEDRIAVGGLCLFHDAGEPETGTDWQAHCNEYINVRTHIRRLGLTSPDKPRQGWRYVGEIPGSRHRGGGGNSIAVVQKVAPTLAVPQVSGWKS